VSEVEHLGDSVDHRVTQRNNRVNASETDPADKVIQEYHCEKLMPPYTKKGSLRVSLLAVTPGLPHNSGD
jgi:hypothetical protein